MVKATNFKFDTRFQIEFRHDPLKFLEKGWWPGSHDTEIYKITWQRYVLPLTPSSSIFVCFLIHFLLIAPKWSTTFPSSLQDCQKIGGCLVAKIFPLDGAVQKFL